MGSDCDTQIRNKSDQELQEIDKKYPGFIQVHAYFEITIILFYLPKTIGYAKVCSKLRLNTPTQQEHKSINVYL